MADRLLKLLVFDMGHVFVDFEWEEVLEGFRQTSGRTQNELKAGFRHLASLGYESGQVTTDEFLKELNSVLGTNLSLAEFSRLWVATFRENPQMAELLSLLKQQRPLYLLSNTNEIHFNHIQSIYNVARHFEELILSYEVGCSKPDPEIYLEVLTRSGVPAGDCLFVDDLEPNVAAARSIGMRAIRFEGIEHLKGHLEGFGLRT